MTGQLVFRNVLHRPLRTLISVVAVGVEVALVLVVVGLTTGMLTEVAKRIQGIGADIMVQPPSSSIFLAFSGAPMPITIGDRLAQLDGIKAVAPVLLQFSSQGGLDIIYGIDPTSFRAVSGGFVYLSGHGLEGPDDILVDDWYAKANHVRAGQKLRVLDHDFRVAGIVEHGKGARLFVPLATMEELSGVQDKASVFFVKCTDPGKTSQVMGEIEKLLPRYEVRPLENFISLMTATRVPGLETFVHAMIALAVSIGFLVIFLSMYTTIIERTREIGVLKSLGASKGYIARVLLSETAVICFSGIVLGVAMGYGTRMLFLSLFPTLTILITPAWILRATLIALAGGLFGSSYPAWLAGRRDPVEALAYE
jgi:putative ABC transport system permease protein